MEVKKVVDFHQKLWSTFNVASNCNTGHTVHLGGQSNL